MSSSSSLSTQYYKRSISANSSPLHTPHLSASNPDLTSLGQYTDPGVSSQPDYPEHVLKVYRADQSYKYFLVHRVSQLFLSFTDFSTCINTIYMNECCWADEFSISITEIYLRFFVMITEIYLNFL